MEFYEIGVAKSERPDSGKRIESNLKPWNSEDLEDRKKHNQITASRVALDNSGPYSK